MKEITVKSVFILYKNTYWCYFVAVLATQQLRLFASVTICVNGELGLWQRLCFHIVNTNCCGCEKKSSQIIARINLFFISEIEAEIGKPVVFIFILKAR
jgi:hypothetical protein